MVQHIMSCHTHTTQSPSQSQFGENLLSAMRKYLYGTKYVMGLIFILKAIDVLHLNYSKARRTICIPNLNNMIIVKNPLY